MGIKLPNMIMWYYMGIYIPMLYMLYSSHLLTVKHMLSQPGFAWGCVCLSWEIHQNWGIGWGNNILRMPKILQQLATVGIPFPESVWAKGSSNSGGMLYILIFSHIVITSSHLHIFLSSHLLIFSFSHLHIFTSSHLIFSSSHLLIFASSHLHIFTSSHLHVFSSSHLLTFTSSHLTFTSFHLHIFSCSLALLPSCSLALLPSCPLALLPSSLSFYYISLLRREAVPTRRHEMQPFRTKWGSTGENCSKIAIFKLWLQPFRTKWGSKLR